MSNTIQYGIDLGTTNSAIAKFDGNEIQIFKNRDQMDVTPSAVRIEKTGRIIVGRRAYQTLFSDPENVATEFKRLMGQSDMKLFKASAKSLSAEELSAEILKSLLEDARRQTDDKIKTCVITVPAAFGQLQCEATAHAAALAGLIEAPLLQEPLAASIAYGMKPDAKDKRWLVYDLGGGTFDIAVISTRNGQLSVIEHQGDNMLGGKDIDRLIVEKIFLPQLETTFNLPSPDDSPDKWKKMVQKLRTKAEEAKIDLSSSNQVVVSLCDIGDDEDGTPIEAEFKLARAELNSLIELYVAQTIGLCRKAIEKAGISLEDLSNVVLVGGPTYMPILREMIKTELNVPVDFSIDPMTVVARGAAIYASTIQTKTSASSKPQKPDTLNLTLSHELIWSETNCLVAGKIEAHPKNVNSISVLIDAETGHWTSGWIPVQKNNYFETKVHLLEGKINRFWVYLRDDKGNDIPVNPDSFSIRHGLTLTEPPLPHSIGAEVTRSDGKSEIDIIFSRSTPLPVSKTVTYKANKTLKPGGDDYLAIKIWEGEYLSDSEANMFVASLKINSSEIRRTIQEGASIELHISINASRLMEVHAYVPSLDQHFQEMVYVPKENQEVILEKVNNVSGELEVHYNKIENLDELIQMSNDPNIQKELDDIKNDLESLHKEQENQSDKGLNDPDDAKRIVQQSKKIRGKISEMENRIKTQEKFPLLLGNLEYERKRVEEVVTKWGSRIEQKEYEILCREADRLVEREDENRMDKILGDFKSIRLKILFKQDWFWKEQYFDKFCEPGTPFINQQEAERLIAEGHQAVSEGNSEKLRDVVHELWELLPKSVAELEMEKALKAGIRKK